MLEANVAAACQFPQDRLRIGARGGGGVGDRSGVGGSVAKLVALGATLVARRFDDAGLGDVFGDGLENLCGDGRRKDEGEGTSKDGESGRGFHGGRERGSWSDEGRVAVGPAGGRPRLQMLSRAGAGVVGPGIIEDEHPVVVLAGLAGGIELDAAS